MPASKIAEYINYNESTNVLVFVTMGVWFNNEHTYRDQILVTMNWMKRLVQREGYSNKAVPQHFDYTDNGYYGMYGANATYAKHKVFDKD